MTTDELYALGIWQVNPDSFLYPRRFYVPTVGEVTIHESDTIEDIFNLIHADGFKNGIIQGKNDKIKEFKRVLEEQEY